MKLPKIIRLFSIISIIAASATPLPATPPAQEAAKKAAEEWLFLVDAGKFGDSWKNAAPYFQSAVTREQWEHSLTAVRGPLGNVVSRKLETARYTKSLPGAPDGDYVVLQFATSFANKKEAVETVTPMLDKDGVWRVSGYYIK